MPPALLKRISMSFAGVASLLWMIESAGSLKQRPSVAEARVVGHEFGASTE
jgi:hypothetical protein